MQHSNTKRNIKGNTIKQEEHLHTLFNASRLVSQVHVLIDLLLTIKNIKALVRMLYIQYQNISPGNRIILS